MILDINKISESELIECYNDRMTRHRNLVHDYYESITNRKLNHIHDEDKDDNPIWKYYYYCREHQLELPEFLRIQWMNEDYNHRINSNHHIECLLNDNELDWVELVSDFYSVNRKHNRSLSQMLDIVHDKYYYAYDYCKFYSKFY